VTTRNARLTAIRSLFRYAALRHPEHAGLIQQVLAIPSKRHAQTIVCFLTPEEVDALLAAPGRTSWYGRRDHALLTLAVQTGLRVSEVTHLTCSDLHLGTGACVHCVGKGRKQRVTPLTSQTVAVMKVWLHERAGNPTDPLFPSRRGRPLTTDAVAWLLAKHVTTATSHCPTLASKSVTPHVLRHYVDGWVMWPARVFPLAGVPRGPVPAT
jgi:site-specific recombinase XerD